MKEGWDTFLNLCVNSDDKQMLAKVFDLLFTYEEKEAMSGRILIIRELLAGNKTQRDIAKDLQISIAKITRGSNALKGIEDEVKTFVKECLKEPH